jgi:hypothetical protein
MPLVNRPWVPAPAPPHDDALTQHHGFDDAFGFSDLWEMKARNFREANAITFLHLRHRGWLIAREHARAQSSLK